MIKRVEGTTDPYGFIPVGSFASYPSYTPIAVQVIYSDKYNRMASLCITGAWYALITQYVIINVLWIKTA